MPSSNRIRFAILMWAVLGLAVSALLAADDRVSAEDNSPRDTKLSNDDVRRVKNDDEWARVDTRVRVARAVRVLGQRWWGLKGSFARGFLINSPAVFILDANVLTRRFF